MNPYIFQGQPMQDVSGLQPVFQNFGQQQANQQAALAQQAQLAGQAGQTQGGGMNPLALAQALRKDKPTQDQLNAKDAQMGGLGTYNPYTQYQVSNAYGTDPYSQQSKMLAAQEF
jgi:hypothetical protein